MGRKRVDVNRFKRWNKEEKQENMNTERNKEWMKKVNQWTAWNMEVCPCSRLDRPRVRHVLPPSFLTTVHFTSSSHISWILIGHRGEDSYSLWLSSVCHSPPHLRAQDKLINSATRGHMSLRIIKCEGQRVTSTVCLQCAHADDFSYLM